MNRFSNAPPQFVNRASPGQGGRFRGGENHGGRAPNSGGRNVPPPPLPEKNSVRDFSSSRGRGGFALSGSRRISPVTDQDSVAMEVKDVKPVAVPNEAMLHTGILKTTPAKVDGKVNGGSINSMEMNNGYGQFNGSNNEGMINGIGHGSSKTVTFGPCPAMEVDLNGGNVEMETGSIGMRQQQSLVNGGHHVLLGQHNHKVVEGLAEIQRLAKSDDLAALKKLSVTLIRTLATAFNDFADSLDKMNSTTQGGGH